MKETMTVHKALSELKILKNRIEDKIGAMNFFVVNKHSNTKINGVPVNEFMVDAKNQYNSVITLINRRNAIKRAVTNSNAVTTVKINGADYTVAEAIDMKNAGLEYYKMILERFDNQWKRVQAQAERENGDKLDNRADEYVKSLYENSDMKNMSEEIRKVRETFVESQTMDIIDPIGAVKVMEKLKNMIDGFMSDVDSALSVSNAITTIEVEYETL